ncbi:MAG: YceI family protein [Chloroflexi bacterium]|nr:YceI family protein [Chloroflexota bacterium]
MHIHHSRARLARPAILATALVAALLPGIASAQSPAASTAPTVPAASSLDGTWTVDPSIGSFDYAAGDFSGSWVGYRVQEELAGIGGTTAVGRTPDVTGSITVSGTAITAADLTADLTTLQSDESMRDGQLGRQGIQTDQFPTATFVLAEPIELGAIPAEGTAISATAIGDLTIHGVTKRVEIALGAVQQGDIIGVSGSLTFTWDDFGMEQPTSMRVVSLANDVTMELQVFFRQDTATTDGTTEEVPAESPAA